MEFGDLRNELRIATATIHQALDESLNLLRDDLTIVEYTSFLQCLLGYHRPAEQWLGQIIRGNAWEKEFTRRSKLSALVSDLDQLCSTPKAVSIASFRRGRSKGTMEDFLGSVYVLEGATLGGMFLAKHFERKFGVTAEWGAAYLNFYGRETRAQFDRYCQWLNAQSDQVSWSRVIDAAITTFSELQTWCERGGVIRRDTFQNLCA